MKILRKAVRLITNEEAAMITSGTHNELVASLLFAELKSMGLTDFEVINILNIKPNSLVCLQTIIDEMVDRLTEEQMSRIVNIFNNKSK